MPYKPLRKDLTEKTRKCDFCPNELTSLKAYVLQEIGTGRLAYAGPTCAEKAIAEPFSLAGLPDLTRFTISNPKDVGGGGGGGGGLSDCPRRKAAEYLILREEKLVKEINSYEVLRDYYEKSKGRDLTDEEVNHINNIEKNAPDHLKLSKLQRTYNYLFWIDIAIAKLPSAKTDFLKDIRRKVAGRMELTTKQKDAVNKCLRRISGIPQLR